MMKPDPKKARMHLKKLRQLIAQRKSPFAGMNKEQVIQVIRKTREELWEHKIAFHT